MTLLGNRIKKTVHLISEAMKNNLCVLVAVDGHGGTGKSTIAGKLADELSGQVVHHDDFYRVMESNARFELNAEEGARKYFDWQRLRRDVLEPLTNGENARYRKYNWGKNELGSEVMVRPLGVVIIEGVYSFRPELKQYYDIGILVDCPRSIRMNRLSTRGDEPEWTKKWDDAEQWYFSHEFPDGEISITVDGF